MNHEDQNKYYKKRPRPDSKKEIFLEFYSLFKKDSNKIFVQPSLCFMFGSWLLEGYKKKFLPYEALEDSKILLEKALNESPENKSYLTNLSICFREMGKIEDAINLCKKSLSIEASYHAFLHLGNCHSDLNNYKDAIDSFEKCLGIMPNHEEAIYNSAVCYKELSNNKKALELFTILTELNQNSPSAFLGKGTILIEMNRLGEAEENLLKALDLKENLTGLRGMLAKLYHKQGRKREALNIKIEDEGAIILSNSDKKSDKIKLLYGKKNG